MLQTNDQFTPAYTQARVYLMQNPNWAFYSALLMLLEDKIDAPGEPTAAVDGKHLFINSEFFVGLGTKAKRATLLAHEALHVALKHMIRAESITQEQWDTFNNAGDYVINQMLLDDGFEAIPGWLQDDKYKNMSTEQVYKLLLEDPPPAPAGGCAGSGVGGSLGSDVRKPKADPQGDPQDPNDPQPAQGQDQAQAMAELSGQIDVMLRQAEQQAIASGMKPGDIPAQIRAYLDNLVKPKLPMRALLRKFMQNLSRDDYSWRKLNRRFRPMILPGLQSNNKLMHLAFAFDMSMSVSKKDYTRYMSEMYGVMRGMQPDLLTLIQFDTRIKSVEKIKSLKDLAKVELKGRGGTHIGELMEWAKKHKPAALIVFSDGEYSHPEFNPGCPVLWLIHGSTKHEFHCDFGTTVLFDV